MTVPHHKVLQAAIVSTGSAQTVESADSVLYCFKLVDLKELPISAYK